MKKYFLSLIVIVTGGLLLSWSCSNNNTSPNNFQGPVTTIVGINPPFTFTPIFTATPTPSSTPTNTPTSTSTPYAVSTWTGFSAPSAIAVDSNNKIYVADTGNNFVERYNSNGTLDITWGAGGLKGKVAYPNPKGIAVDSSFDLFIVGNGNVVTKYSPVTTGAGLMIQATSPATLSGPKGIFANGTTLVVADTGNSQVVQMDSNGGSQQTYPAGSAVFGTAIDSNGNVFASTGTNNTVVKLNASPLTIPGFSNPIGLAVDSANNLWVADKGNKQVEEFSGTALSSPPLVIFNASGTLNAPSGVAVDASGNIYVADSAANVVVKFAP